MNLFLAFLFFCAWAISGLIVTDLGYSTTTATVIGFAVAAITVALSTTKKKKV